MPPTIERFRSLVASASLAELSASEYAKLANVADGEGLAEVASVYWGFTRACRVEALMCRAKAAALGVCHWRIRR